MKRLMTLTTALVLGAGLAQAQDFTPGADFMNQWDLDSNGGVSLVEVREQRGNIFAMFDENSDGRLSAAEIVGMDEHKQLQREAGMGPGRNRPEGMTGPMGNGMGKGRGGQMGPQSGFDRPAAEEMRGLDANGDGIVTTAEFVNGSANWFRMRDRNGDNVLTTADFGPPRG